jgi:transcriptional regulator with XRE-family HTH domain
VQTKPNVGTVRVKSAGERTATRIRSILTSRRLTLNQVSAESERLYGLGSPSSIPHTLYHSLENSPLFGPSLLQTCTLSRISGYRLEDWLGAVGIDMKELAGLQASLPFGRTRLIDPALDGTFFTGGDLEERRIDDEPRAVTPLGRLFRWNALTASRTSGNAPNESEALFARIGCEDVFAFPELLPGSIVRVKPKGISPLVTDGANSSHPRLLLIEENRGLWCGRFHVSGNGTLHAAASEMSYAPIAFRSPQEARILGYVDMEIRWMHRFEKPIVPRDFAQFQIPQALESKASSLGVFIRQARARAGLTLHEASLFSHKVAQALDDRRYAMAPSTLADYETQSTPPRHLEKAMTLCLIYAVPLVDFVRAAGTAPEHLGTQFIPRALLPPEMTAAPPGARPEVAESSSSLRLQFGSVPWFLGSSLAQVSGIPRPSMRDFFWLTGEHPFLPAYTGDSMLALVDRNKKSPLREPNLPAWLQPAYVLLLRDGQYRCACCSLDEENLFLFPRSESGRLPERLRLGRDAEVVGQIVGLARRIER